MNFLIQYIPAFAAIFLRAESKHTTPAYAVTRLAIGWWHRTDIHDSLANCNFEKDVVNGGADRFECMRIEHDNFTPTLRPMLCRAGASKIEESEKWEKKMWFSRTNTFPKQILKRHKRNREKEKNVSLFVCSIWYSGQKHLTSHDFMFIVCGADSGTYAGENERPTIDSHNFFFVFALEIS